MQDENPYEKNMDSQSYTYDEDPKEMDSHSYRNVHSENLFKKIWIVICTEMCMKKTNTTKMDSHSHKNVHNENPFKKKWIVFRTKMYQTKTNKNVDSPSYRKSNTTENLKSNKALERIHQVL